MYEDRGVLVAMSHTAEAAGIALGEENSRHTHENGYLENYRLRHAMRMYTTCHAP